MSASFEDAAVSIDVDNERLWMGDLGPHRRRQSESHRAQATRGEPRPGATELVELCRPHLVLAHAHRDDRVAFGREPGKLGDGVLRQDAGEGTVV